MEAAHSIFSPSFGALLFWTVAIPFIASVLLLITGGAARSLSRAIAVGGFAAPTVLALVLAWNFSAAEAFEGFRFYTDSPLGLSQLGISLKLGLNGISMPLFVMTALVGLAAGLYAIFGDYERKNIYLFLLMLMFAGLLGFFASIDLFFFYFFHEVSLIPTFIMIGLWGGRSRRIAAMEMTIYLMLGSMIVLAGLIALYVESGVQSFSFIDLRNALADGMLEGGVQHYVFGLLLIGFGILVSLFPFHSWAPRGYANAPASAAMLHAGVLKKFGLYGLIQMVAPILPAGLAGWADLLIWLALGNVIIIGLITIAQRDLRYMIGYGSVMHMGYAFLGLATFSTLGAGGAVFMMFAHGLSIALLFLLADCISRRGDGSDMATFGGMARQTPVLAAFFTAAILASIGLPGFSNFWGELSIFTALLAERPWAGAAAILGIIISAIYGLRAVARIFFGEPSEEYAQRLNSTTVQDISCAERAPAVILILALLITGIWPRSITEALSPAVEQLYPETDVNVSALEDAHQPVAVTIE